MQTLAQKEREGGFRIGMGTGRARTGPAGSAHPYCSTDLLICCGDYQSVRNMADLDSMACPDKYKDMQTRDG